jgi:hypothetical protein
VSDGRLRAAKNFIPDGGAVVLREEVTLTRQENVELAQREIPVDRTSVIVAFVDEQVTDVRVKLSVNGDTANGWEQSRRCGSQIAHVPRAARVSSPRR